MFSFISNGKLVVINSGKKGKRARFKLQVIWYGS